MVVLLVVAGLVAPRVSGVVPSLRLSKAADELIATLVKARTDAALTSRRFRVQVRPVPEEGRRPYWYLAFEPDPLQEPGRFDPLPGDWGRPLELADHLLFATLEGAPDDLDRSGEAYVEFSPDGTATEAAIVLAHENGEQILIRIDPATGTARIDDGEVSR